MLYEGTPVWVFPPNWGTPVTERLEWKTDVLTSESGAEQRIPRLQHPWRTLSATFLLDGNKRQLFDTYAMQYSSQEMLVPLWPYVGQVGQAATAGQDLLYVDTQWAEYKPGDKILLRSIINDWYEVGVVDVVTATTLKLISPLSRNVPQGTWVYPCRLGRLLGQISATKRTARTFEFTADFRITERYVHDWLWYPPAHKDVSVFDIHPDDSEELAHEYIGNYAVFEGDMAAPSVADLTGYRRTKINYKWSFVGRENQYKVRQILYYLRGRNRAVWVPTYMQDVTLADPVSTFDTSITVKHTGYSGAVTLPPNRTDLRIALKDGNVIYRTISSVVAIDANTELISFAIPAFLEFTPDEVAGISFLVLSRLDTDVVEITHTTDSHGVIQVTLPWIGPVEVDPLPELSSTFYPQYFWDYAVANPPTFSYAELRDILKHYTNWPTESAQAGMGVFSYGLLDDILLHYTDWPTESAQASMGVFTYGDFRQILKHYQDWPTEAAQAGMGAFTYGTLNQVLIHYTNWPTESMQASMATFSGGSLV